MVEAIRVHLASVGVVRGDETSWRIQARGEMDESQHAWLWVCVRDDAMVMHIDAKRSAVAGMKLFEGLIENSVLVCDRYSAYSLICEELEAQRALCWAHAQRDFLQAVTGDKDKLPWLAQWLQAIGDLYGCNEQRLKHWDASLPRHSRQYKALASLLRHEQGLWLFVSNTRLCRWTITQRSVHCAGR